MKMSFFSTAGILLILSMTGCCYNPGMYNPNSCCTVGDGWQAGCTSHGCPPAPSAPCGTSCDTGCGVPQCGGGCGHSHHGDFGSCYGGHSGCQGGRPCPLNPLVWIRHIFDFTFCCNRYYIPSTTDFICSPGSGQGCQSGYCGNGGYQTGSYETYDSGQYQTAPPASAPPASAPPAATRPVPAPAPMPKLGAPSPVTYHQQMPNRQVSQWTPARRR